MLDWMEFGGSTGHHHQMEKLWGSNRGCMHGGDVQSQLPLCPSFCCRQQLWARQHTRTHNTSLLHRGAVCVQRPMNNEWFFYKSKRRARPFGQHVLSWQCCREPASLTQSAAESYRTHQDRRTKIRIMSKLLAQAAVRHRHLTWPLYCQILSPSSPPCFSCSCGRAEQGRSLLWTASKNCWSQMAL